jgi:acyl-coenzyme A synthetase/AMP-(fatty) acid ligase
VLGPDLAPVPRGAPGQLAVDARDPGLMLGYLDAPEATAARRHAEWFLTGDTVVMAEDGAITTLGREDDQMNAGGYRVSPAEIEAAMAGFHGLEDCAAVEVEVRAGVRIIACAYTGPAPLPDEALAAHAEARLARYKQPRLWRHLPALPRSANHKLDRKRLREELAR